MSAGRSVLEFLLPDGRAAAVGMLGSGTPSLLRSPSPPVEPPWDIIVVAPSEREARSRSWVDATARAAAHSVSRDGLVYVLAPVITRLRLGHALRQAGLSVTSGMLHLPDKGTSQVLLSLDRKALQEVARRLVAPGVGRTTLRVAAALGAGRWLRCHPTAALLARRPGARPLGEWLAIPVAGTIADLLVAIRVRRHAHRERVVLHLQPIDGRAGVAKAVLRPDASGGEIRVEAKALADLAPAARAAGAEVPSCRVVELAPGRDVLVQEVVDGAPAAWTLSRADTAFEPLIVQLGAWLARWGSATRVVRRPGADFFRRMVLDPAMGLAERLPDGAGYLSWLESRCRLVEGMEVPLVATHGDLTMSNVLLRSDGRLGIVDWEAAEPSGLPLTDFYYSVVDAAAAHGNYRDWPGAFERCFRLEGPTMAVVRLVEQRLARALEVTDEVATLAFHACWLRHAANERQKRAPGEPTPFLRHLQSAAGLREVIHLQEATRGQDLSAAF